MLTVTLTAMVRVEDKPSMCKHWGPGIIPHPQCCHIHPSIPPSLHPPLPPSLHPSTHPPILGGCVGAENSSTREKHKAQTQRGGRAGMGSVWLRTAAWPHHPSPPAAVTQRGGRTLRHGWGPGPQTHPHPEEKGWGQRWAPGAERRD